jgi:integrase
MPDRSRGMLSSLQATTRPSGAKSCGSQDARFHDLRHTYAALMVAAGAHPKLLQAQLGHSSINVTLNTYGHLFPDAFKDVGHSLDRLVLAAERDARGVDLGLEL